MKNIAKSQCLIRHKNLLTTLANGDPTVLCCRHKVSIFHIYFFLILFKGAKNLVYSQHIRPKVSKLKHPFFLLNESHVYILQLSPLPLLFHKVMALNSWLGENQAKHAKAKAKISSKRKLWATVKYRSTKSGLVDSMSLSSPANISSLNTPQN